MHRFSLALVSAALYATLASAQQPTAVTTPTGARSCSMATATPWITKWFGAWELTESRILKVEPLPPPEVVFFDSTCVYTTSALTAGGAKPGDGPTLFGKSLPWRAVTHGDSITLPDSSRIPIRLISSSGTTTGGVFFVMAAPELWGSGGGVDRNGLAADRTTTAVFVHEFGHMRQMPLILPVMEATGKQMRIPHPQGDDMVQLAFGKDSAYVNAYMTERDMFYRAATADSLAQVRALARRALALARARRAHWFTGDSSQYAAFESEFLSLEGVGQWSAYAWLSNPQGGAFLPTYAVAAMRGRGRFWTQDEGLGMFLTINRLMPDWPSLIFSGQSIGAFELLERAVERNPGS